MDNLQLAILQAVPAEPTPWTPLTVWGSLLLGAIYLVGTFLLNGGSGGRDYLPRYFSISGVVALWIAIPFQLTISLPRFVDALADLAWYVPAVIFASNVMFFSFVAFHIYDVARKSMGYPCGQAEAN